MRILHFLRSARSDIGGPARAVVDLCGALAKRGHDVTLATIQGADLPQDWSRRGHALPTVVEVARPQIAGLAYLRSGTTPLASLIAAHDVLHVHGMWDVLNVQLCRIADRHRKPYVISIRGMLGAWSMRQSRLRKLLYLRLFGNRWLRRARKIHFTAQAEFDQAQPWLPARMGMVIPNLLDLEPFTDMPGAESAMAAFPTAPGRRRLLYLSRLHPKKGVETFVKAIRKLKDRGIRVCGLIAGGGDTGYVDSVHALAASLGLSPDECRLLGPVTGSLKVSLYQSADLFVLPTNQENFGFVFIEALASGLPVMTTRGVDIWPDLQASGAAKLIDVDADSVAHMIEATMREPEELAAMRARGRDWVFCKMDPERLIEMFENLYRA